MMKNTYVFVFPSQFDYELGDSLIQSLHQSKLFAPFESNNNYEDCSITITSEDDSLFFTAQFDNTVIRYELVKHPQLINDVKRWYSCELDKDDARRFKSMLKNMHIQYEPSECFEKIHFEVYCTRNDVDQINAWIDSNLT